MHNHSPFSPSFFKRQVHVQTAGLLFVYPFKTRGAWWLKGRYAHVIAAVEASMGRFGASRRDQLKNRMGRMKKWNLAQVVLLALLYIGAATTAFGALADFFNFGQEAVDALHSLARATGPASGVILVAILLIRRVLSQLEADVLMLVMLRGK